MHDKLLRSCLAIVVVSSLLFTSILSNSFAQGVATVKSSPVTINKAQVTTEVSLDPSYLPASPSSTNTMTVRTFQTASGNNANTTISKLNYRLQVMLGNATLLDQRFASADGIIAAKLILDSQINGWQVNGQTHSPTDQIPVSQSNPVEIRSKILSTGGAYHFIVTLEKGSQGLALSDDQKFDIYINVSQEYDFNGVKTLSGPADFKIRSFNDQVTDLKYLSNSENNSLSIVMPFDWRSQYAQSTQLVHLEVEFPKSVAELQANSYQGTVNGVVVPQRSLLIDDFSIPQLRIVHVVLSRPTLDLLSERIKSETNVLHVVLTPLTGKPKFPVQIQSTPRGDYVFELSWGPAIIQSGVQTTFSMDMLDPKTGDTTNANFDFVLTQNGTEVFKTPLSSGLGLYTQQYTFPKEGVYRLAASNINGGGESAGLNLIVQKGNGTSSSSSGTSGGQPSGCLIATAAFGSELTPQVQYLRNFRDQFVMKSETGAAFMSSFNSVYYSFSPQVADYERQQPWMQASVRTLVYPLLGILTLSEKAHYLLGGEAGTMVAGALASAMIGAAYLWPAGAAVVKISQKRCPAKWLVLAVTVAAVAMVVSWLAYPAMLYITTSAFVVVSAAASSLAAGLLVTWIATRRQAVLKKKV
ncbi:MAG: CFI-box-CTERM domain-containing protein [Nitrososphaera sp.]|jgi:peptide/nickel transport system substrate-binding protein